MELGETGHTGAEGAAITLRQKDRLRTKLGRALRRTEEAIRRDPDSGT